jgi:hypothetical protein
MKAKWVIFLIGVSVLTIILFTGYQPMAATPPTGEVKTVAAGFGNQIPVPFFEQVHSFDWL